MSSVSFWYVIKKFLLVAHACSPCGKFGYSSPLLSSQWWDQVATGYLATGQRQPSFCHWQELQATRSCSYQEDKFIHIAGLSILDYQITFMSGQSVQKDIMPHMIKWSGSISTQKITQEQKTLLKPRLQKSSLATPSISHNRHCLGFVMVWQVWHLAPSKRTLLPIEHHGRVQGQGGHSVST